jgi:hypothetical protein
MMGAIYGVRSFICHKCNPIRTDRSTLDRSLIVCPGDGYPIDVK